MASGAELRIGDLESENTELRTEIAALRGEIAELRNMNASLQARITDLEARLSQNSRNSSVPPSSAGLTKPPASNRARSKRKRRPGKQPGTEGHHLSQVAVPDEVIVHDPEVCAGCGGSLANALVVGAEVRQVFHLPEIKPYVTEHRMEKKARGCGVETKATAPPEATAPACYGPSIRALAVYLSVYQHVPYDRLSEIFADVLGIPVSVGALTTMVTEAGGGLGLFSLTVADLLREAPAVHFDETGARVAGSLHWIHVASTSLYTLIFAHKRRGTVAMDDMGIIAKMAGTAVHDGWKPYRTYEVTHALCNAHHLRELTAVEENLSQDWATKMIELLLDAKEAVERAVASGAKTLDPSALQSIRVRYGTLIEAGWRANPSHVRGRPYGRLRRKAVKLLERLDVQRDDVLRFTADFKVPFDNNQGERDIRMVKLQRKISGSWRTKRGADHFCAIRSYVSTMKKHHYNVLDGLRELFQGGVWLPGGT